MFVKTPLFHSRQLSERLGCKVYLKLENLQPSQSFKYRGMLTFIQHCFEKRGSSTHLYCASGGNAGLACAAVAAALKLKCTVCIPLGNSREIVETLISAGAQVIEHGNRYIDSLNHVIELVEADPNGFLVPAYDDPLLWKGHSTMISEISEQLQEKPRGIFCSVGGGGLLGGVLLGTAQVGWSDVPVFALETDKSACFYHSIMMNRHGDEYEVPDFVESLENKETGIKLAKLTPMSKASSLGASSPAAEVVKMALNRVEPVRCITIPDEFAMLVAIEFTALHKFLIELACATALSPAFSKDFFQKCCSDVCSEDSIVFICCGGAKISIEEMKEYKDLIQDATEFRQATIEGREYEFI